MLIVMVFLMLFISLRRQLSDRFGRKPLLMAGFIGFLFLVAARPSC